MTDTASTRGAVAALVIATAPNAAPQAADLLWRPVSGRQVAAWTLDALHHLGSLEYCGVVASPDHHDDVADIIVHEAPARVSAILPSTEATWRGALPPIEMIPARCEWVVVLDATLPLATVDVLRAGLRAAERTGVAIAAEPVKETLKLTRDHSVVETPPRASLARLHAPVIFRRDALQRALDARTPISDGQDNDDLIALAQRAGVPLTVFDAGYPCVRVTSEDDLGIVASLLSQRESERHPL